MSGLVDQDVTFRIGWFMVQNPPGSFLRFATQAR